MTAKNDDALADHLLVLRAQLGARDAYARLVDRHHARLRFYLRRLVGPSTDADDLLQEVWLIVVRKLGTLDSPEAFPAWLYRVARHHAISWLRKRRIEVPFDEAGPDAEAAASAEIDDASGWAPEDAAAMYAALETLSPSHREMLTLRFLSGLTYDEIARVLERPVGTVRSRIHYAKAALRAVLRDPERDTAKARTKGGLP
jgi:RNA polymerase sigma-70 factor, ECF subfamily